MFFSEWGSGLFLPASKVGAHSMFVFNAKRPDIRLVESGVVVRSVHVQLQTIHVVQGRLEQSHLEHHLVVTVSAWNPLTL